MTTREPRGTGGWPESAKTAWVWLVPLAATAVLGAALAARAGALLLALCAATLIGAVLAAVHHAEVVAHRVGEPFGTLVLAVAVTVIEASLILSMLIVGGSGAARLPRDTIYAALMLILNGVVGACLLVGGLRHGLQSFRVEGANSGLAALFALATLSLVLPTFTVSTPGGTYSNAQLAFAAIASIALWAVFVFVQTVRHRDYFLPESHAEDPERHADPPSSRAAWASFALLLVSLVAVVGLAKVLSPTIERGIDAAGAPQTVIGIAIAILVLLPETGAAVRAARANRLQTSMNLAVGSALASIGLTIPVVAMASVVLGIPLVLGLEPKDLVMLALTFVVSAVTLGTGRTHMMQGAVHLVIFGAFLFLALVP
jgi:Ca2+:H+ antiporter